MTTATAEATTATEPAVPPALPEPTVTATVALTAVYADMVAALATVAPAVPSRPVIPVLQGVRFHASGDGSVRVSAFDFETSVSTSMSVTNFEPGADLLVSHAALRKTLTAATKGLAKARLAAVTVTVGGQLTVTSYRARSFDRNLGREIGDPTVKERREVTADVTVNGFTVPVTTFELGDYPQVPQPQPTSHTVDRVGFTTAARRVAVAAGHDDVLRVLTGVHMHLAADRVSLAATDRYRFAVQDLLASVTKAGHADGVDVLIPGGVLIAVLAHFTGPQLSVGADRKGENVTISDDVTTVTVRTIDGVFPSVERLLPSEFATVVTADRLAITQAVARATALAAIANSDSRSNVVIVAIDGNGCTVTPKVDDGQSRAKGVHLDADVTGGVPGDTVTVAANGATLGDALGAFTGDTVTFGVTTPNKPILLADTVEGLHAPGEYRHLVMPYRLPG